MNMMDEEEEKLEEDEDFYVNAVSNLKLQKQQTLPSNPVGLGKKPIQLVPRNRDSLDNIDEVSSHESGELDQAPKNKTPDIRDVQVAKNNLKRSIF